MLSTRNERTSLPTQTARAGQQAGAGATSFPAVPVFQKIESGGFNQEPLTEVTGWHRMHAEMGSAPSAAFQLKPLTGLSPPPQKPSLARPFVISAESSTLPAAATARAPFQLKEAAPDPVRQLLAPAGAFQLKQPVSPAGQPVIQRMDGQEEQKSQEPEEAEPSPEAFLVQVRARTAEILGELSFRLSQVSPDLLDPVFVPLVKRFLGGPSPYTTVDVIKNHLLTLTTVLANIKLEVADIIGGGIANAETRAPNVRFPGFEGFNTKTGKNDKAKLAAKNGGVSPADITLATRSLHADDLLAKKNLGKRVFTVLHELTHSALGTLDITNSIPGNVDRPRSLTEAGSLKSGKKKTDLYKNADSLVLFLLNLLAALKEKEGSSSSSSTTATTTGASAPPEGSAPNFAASSNGQGASSSSSSAPSDGSAIPSASTPSGQ